MSCIMDRATGCCLLGRAGEQQSSGCASQDLVERSEGALTHYFKSPTTTSNPLPTFAGVCDSHGRGMTSVPHRRAGFLFFFLRMDAQTLGGKEEEEEEKKKDKHLSCRACICVAAHAPAKTKLAVCYSQAVETDLPQCFHCLMRGEREGCKKER